MSDIDDQIRRAPVTLEALLEKDFPAENDPPHPHYAWDFYCAFLANAPRRLISIIEAEYHDPAQAEPGEDKDQGAMETDYLGYFERAIAATEAAWGPATRLPSANYQQRAREWGVGHKLGSVDGTDHALFDDDMFNFDRSDIAYWRRGDRIALIHFASQWGDGDFQLSVCACVVPSDRSR